MPQSRRGSRCRRYVVAFSYADCDEADVVGVGYDADRAAVVEGDVELAGRP